MQNSKLKGPFNDSSAAGLLAGESKLPGRIVNERMGVRPSLMSSFGALKIEIKSVSSPGAGQSVEKWAGCGVNTIICMHSEMCLE